MVMRRRRGRACLSGASAPALRACWRTTCRSAPVATCDRLRPGRRRATHAPCLLLYPAGGRGFPEAVAELGGVRRCHASPVNESKSNCRNPMSAPSDNENWIIDAGDILSQIERLIYCLWVAVSWFRGLVGPAALEYRGMGHRNFRAGDLPPRPAAGPMVCPGML